MLQVEMVLLAIFALILGLATLSDRTDPAQAAREQPLILMLASDQAAYQVGGPVTFTIAVDNPGHAAVPMMFTSGRRYDIVALAGDAEIWRWSAGRDFVDEEVELSFPPGVTLLGRTTWDWHDASGALLSPGSYRFVGTLTGTRRLSGNVVVIELRGP